MPIYLEGMVECYILDPLVIKGLSHSVPLGISFLKEYNLKMTCMEEEVALILLKDGLALRAMLVDRGCHIFINKRLGRVLKATEDQMMTMQVWRIPHERICVNTLIERLEEAVGVYAKDDCSILAGMQKYIPVQTNCEITGEVLIEISDKTIPRLVLPEIVYNIKKKLDCICVENIITLSLFY